MTAATNELIERLVADLRPLPRGAALRRLALGAGTGALLALGLMLSAFGARPDLMQAPAQFSFWIKLGATLLAAVAGLLATTSLARPGGRGRRGAGFGLGVFLATALLALGQFAVADGNGRAMLFGHSAAGCPLAIAVLALPVLGGVVWALRGLAPTRTDPAGFAAGLFAGSLAAFVYSFSCMEPGIPFLAVWYTLGILSAGMLGWAAARIGLLHW